MIWGYVRPQAAASAPEPAAGAMSAPSVGAEVTRGGYEPTIAPCGCFAVLGDDHSLDRLRDMVRAGVGQMEASRAIWGIT